MPPPVPGLSSKQKTDWCALISESFRNRFTNTHLLRCKNKDYTGRDRIKSGDFSVYSPRGATAYSNGNPRQGDANHSNTAQLFIPATHKTFGSHIPQVTWLNATFKNINGHGLRANTTKGDPDILPIYNAKATQAR